MLKYLNRRWWSVAELAAMALILLDSRTPSTATKAPRLYTRCRPLEIPPRFPQPNSWLLPAKDRRTRDPLQLPLGKSNPMRTRHHLSLLVGICASFLSGCVTTKYNYVPESRLI